NVGDESVNPSRVLLEVIAAENRLVCGVLRDRSSFSSAVCHVAQVKNQGQGRHQARIFPEMLDDNLVVLLAQFEHQSVEPCVKEFLCRITKPEERNLVHPFWGNGTEL